MDGTTYTWDDGFAKGKAGNLLSDGLNTYSYDAANRLIAVSNAQIEVEYGYNGLGERLRQTVDSTTTNFTADLEGGLSQVLSDGTHTYLYGNGRMAQFAETETGYFLGDALGSALSPNGASPPPGPYALPPGIRRR
jgi:YD repeat-containing protein